MAEARPPYAYRDDPDVPPFDDSKALFVFDGVCVLCSGGASWLMRFDGKRRVNFTSAQGPLGQALYAHFDLEMDESYLLIDGGRAYTASAGYLQLCKVLGGPWHLLRIGALIPAILRDWAYAQIARNRYRWFGKTEFCVLLDNDQRQRLICVKGTAVGKPWIPAGYKLNLRLLLADPTRLTNVCIVGGKRHGFLEILHSSFRYLILKFARQTEGTDLSRIGAARNRKSRKRNCYSATSPSTRAL